MKSATEPTSKLRLSGIALILTLALALGGTGVAVAQDNGPQGRDGSPPAAAVQAQSGSGSESSSEGSDGLRSNIGALPFTGLDLLILGGLAMVLLGTGMALRRLSAPRVKA